MEKEKKLVKNTLILSIGTVLPRVATFITLPIYTRWLTKTEYGTYDLILTLISLIAPAMTLQIQNAAFRHLISEKDDGKKSEIISASYIFVMLISVMLACVAMLLFIDVPVVTKLLIIAFFIIDTFNQLTLQIARGMGQNKSYTINTVINSFTNLILVIPLLIGLNLGLNGLLLSCVIAGMISLVYLLKKIKIHKFFSIKKYKKETLKDLLRYSIPLVPNSISWWIVSSCDKLIVTAFLGIQYNAIYAAASKIPHIYNILYNAFYMSWQESASSNNGEGAEEYYSNVFANLYKILSGLVILLIGITPIVFVILLNNEYIEAYNQIPILYISMFLSSFANFYAGIYIAMKKTKSVAITTVVAAVINVIINISLIRFIGLYAATISSLIAYLTITIWRGIDLNKYYKIKYNFKNIFKYILLIIIASVLCFINNKWLNVVNIIFTSICFILINKKYIIMIFNKGYKILKDNKKV